MISLPSTTKQWKQANNSDLFGNISVTKNINFDKDGYLKLSNATKAIMNASKDADFDNPSSITYNSFYNYLITTWDLLFETGIRLLSGYPTKIVTADVPSGSIETDSIIFDNLIPVTQNTDIHYYDITAGTWTDTNVSLTNNGQHSLVNFLSQRALAVANVSSVNLYASPLSATPTLITTLNIASNFEITRMCYINQNLYIGTQEVNGGKACLYVWNGSGSAAQQVYEVDSNVILSLCPHKGTVYLMTAQGALLAFNGSGFTMVDALPIFYTDYVLTTALGGFTNYKNIMQSNGDVIYILINNQTNSSDRLLNQPDGIWCYDDKVGLYHRYALSASLMIVRQPGTAGVDTTENTITVASPGIVTGTEVFYQDGTIGGLTIDTKYFAIYVDATHIKLATTKANAIAGTAIDLTTTGSADNNLIFYPNIDYGQTWSRRTMALSTIEATSVYKNYGADIIYGAEVNQRTLTGDDAILGTTSPALEARGYFITPKVFSENITDTFNLLTLKYSKLTSELDKIIIKYRTSDTDLEKIDISSINYWKATWTSTNTFTTTQSEFSNAVVGDEVEFLIGAAGGLLAHITEIVNNSGTYTVTIDETFDNYISTDVSTFMFRNWKKFAVIDSNGEGYLSQEIGKSGKYIQFKIELRGLGVKIEELKVDNKSLLPAKR